MLHHFIQYIFSSWGYSQKNIILNDDFNFIVGDVFEDLKRSLKISLEHGAKRSLAALIKHDTENFKRLCSPENCGAIFLSYFNSDIFQLICDNITDLLHQVMHTSDAYLRQYKVFDPLK